MAVSANAFVAAKEYEEISATEMEGEDAEKLLWA